jgi:hypothetical protein
LSHFAKVENNLVTQVIVAEPDFIATGALGDPAAWIQTSYNTIANSHPEGRPLRGNYAGVGYTYDATNDVFVAPQPSADHILDADTWTWWNPTDPEAVKPVRVIVEAPVVEVPAELIVDVPAVEETPVDAPAVEEAPVEIPAEVVEASAETLQEVAPK